MWFDENGWIQKEIPTACVENCSHSGRCDDDVEHWQKELDFQVPREKAIEYLVEFGAWTIEELNALDDTELAHKVLWIACNDISEQGDWLGLIH